jgi:hypothetical protein
MAIGDTVQAGLMRVDFSPFLEAGRANAAANASFGQALGQVAKGYIEGQEKKKRANEIAGFLIGQGVGEKDAQAIAKNPFLQNEYQRGQETKAKMKMERERLATQANIAAQGRAARQAEIDQKYEREDAAKAEIEQEEALIDRFLSLPTTQDMQLERTDNNPLMANVPGPTTQVPGGYEGNRFLQTEEGKSLYSRMIDEGLDPSNSLKQMQSFEAQLLANQQKAMTPEELLSLKGKILDFELKQNEENRKSTEFSDSESIKTFTPESNYLQLGTTKIPITGRLGSQTEAIKYKDEYIPNFNTTNETFEGLLALGQKRADGWYMESQEKDQAMSYVRQLQGLIREDILGPGTVQESERNILDNIVKNPTSWSINGAEENMNILRNLRQKIFNRLENRMKNFNLKLGDSNSPNTPKDQPDYTDETSSGNRIRIFDFDNLNQ